jgi:RNA recognition motif-containing protein
MHDHPAGHPTTTPSRHTPQVAEAAAQEAISSTHDSQLGGRVVTVNEAQPPGERSGGDGSFERRSDRGGGSGSPREAPPAVREGCRRLYVGNLRFDCKAQQLAELFSKFGRVEVRRVPTLVRRALVWCAAAGLGTGQHRWQKQGGAERVCACVPVSPTPSCF